jgi:hypothetical protein
MEQEFIILQLKKLNNYLHKLVLKKLALKTNTGLLKIKKKVILIYIRFNYGKSLALSQV